MSRIKTVKQITSKTTAVKCNAYDSVIETVSLVDAADTSFQFVVNNSVIKKVSAILLSTEYAGTTGSPIATLVSYERGKMTIKISNVGVAVLNAPVRVCFKITHN